MCSLDTDIKFGNTNGFDTCWMDTGVHTMEVRYMYRFPGSYASLTGRYALREEPTARPDTLVHVFI